MRDRQVEPQRLQLKVWTGMAAEAPWIFLLRRFSEVGPARVIKGGDDLVDGAAPGLTVSSKCWSLVVVNVAGSKGLLKGVFKTFLWCRCVPVAILGCRWLSNSGDMPCLVQQWLQQHGLFAGDFCLIKDVKVANVVTPMNVEDVAETELMKGLR